MSVATNAILSKKDKVDILVGTPTWVITGTDGLKRTVEVRQHRDGSQSFLSLRNEPGVGIVPMVLATVDKDGAVTYGGSGGIYDTEQSKTRNSARTTPEQAKAFLDTGLIDGKAATIDEQLNIGNTTGQQLAKSANTNTRTANQTPFVVSQRITSGNNTGVQALTTEPFTVLPIQGLVAGAGDVFNSIVTPGNNDPNASNGADFIGQFAGQIGDGVKDVTGFLIEKGVELNENLMLSDNMIAEFDKLFEVGGGDKIVSARYPVDANYGDIRGQDYVTIDQFIYQPPRRNQILGDRGPGGINPIENISQGTQRITPLKKFVAQVKLPMPNDITDSNAVAWGDDAMNGMSAALTSAVMQNPAAGIAGGIAGAVLSPTVGRLLTLGIAGVNNDGIVGPDGQQDASMGGRVQAALKMMAGSGGEAIVKTQMGAGILGMLGANVTPESLLARGFGVVPNSNLELLFNNITLRDFQFSWRMSPRDEEEAKMVKRVIRFFKQGMAAKTMKSQAGERTLYLGTPNVFRLQYRTAGGRIIEGVNRIKPCAVVGTAVNYTPDGQWSAYDEGQPVSCTLSIQMKELEPVYATDYSEKVLSDRRSNDRTGTEEQFIGPFADRNRAVQDIGVSDGDLYSIRPTEVGY